MSDDNIIRFRKPQRKKQPRTITPGTRKALTWIGVVAAAVAIWAYFQFVGGGQ